MEHVLWVMVNMYQFINLYAKTILDSIKQGQVSSYDWLHQEIGTIQTSAYRKEYRRYWRMNAARLSSDFYTTYFDELDGARRKEPTLEALSHRLYHASEKSGGTKSLQFWFATKLLHMSNPRLPIYDSRVARFYFFEVVSTDQPLEERVGHLLDFHGFLVQEYERVLNNGILRIAIQTFRQHFSPEHFTDEKCIDSLLWAFVRLLEKGGLPLKQIVYR